MTEKSHSELQRFHYTTVRANPSYRMEGQMAVMMEELAASIPAYDPPEPQEPEPEWTRQQWNIIQQLRAQVQYLQHQVVKTEQPDGEGSARPRKVGVKID